MDDGCPAGQMFQAADIGGGDHIRLYGGDIGEFAGAQIVREFGLQDKWPSGMAATSKPATVSRVSFAPDMRSPCCSEHGA